MTMSRRGLVASAVALAAGGARAQGRPFFERTGLPIGLQLYTLGDAVRADLDGVLRAVAAIGYRTVQVSSWFGRSPAQLRQSLDAAGLKASSAHIQPLPRGLEPALDGDLPRLIDDCRILGITSVYMPMFMRSSPAGAPMTLDDWKRNADFLNTKGAALTKAGLTFGYHNHNQEFAPLPAAGGFRDGFDVLLRNTDPDLVGFELDVGWAAAAGRDPLELFRTYPRRFPALHVKDIERPAGPNYVLRQSPTEVGSGFLDWKTILPAAHAAGAREFFVEQEPPFARPRLEAAAMSYRYLAALVG